MAALGRRCPTRLGPWRRECHDCQVHPIVWSVSSWGLLAVAAVVVGVGVGVGLLRRRWSTLTWSMGGELGAVAVIAGFVGAKLGHVLFEAKGHVLRDGGVATGVVDLLRDDPWHWARLTEPGFVQLAGVVCAAAAVLALVHRLGADARRADVADAAAIATAAAVAVGRLGCLLAGCCYGRPSDVAWAIHFPVDHISGGVGVHPTQLYDVAVALLAMSLGLLRFRASPGAAAVVAGLVLLGGRFATEFWRGDADRGGVVVGTLALSTSQLISLALLTLLILGVVAHRGRRAASATPSTTNTERQG